MTYTDMMIDVSWHLFFFGFGMIAGALVFWLERVK